MNTSQGKGKRGGRPDIVAMQQIRANKTPSNDADYLQSHIVQVNRPADDLWIAGELRLPSVVAEHADRVGSFHPVVAVGEQAAELRRGVKERKIAAAGYLNVDFLRAALQYQIRTGGENRHGRVENIVQVSQRAKSGKAERRTSEVRHSCDDLNDAMRLAYRKALEQNTIHECEDRCVRSDAESQRQQRDGREAGRFPKAAYRVAKVLHDLLQPDEGTFVTVKLFGLLHAAVGSPRSQSRIPESHALPQILVFEHGQVRGYFPHQLILGAISSKEITELGPRALELQHIVRPRPGACPRVRSSGASDRSPAAAPSRRIW